MMKLGIILLGLLLVGCASMTDPAPPAVAPEFVPVRPIIATPPPQDNGSIYQNGYGISLFSDVSAKRVGDLITVILSENTNARKSASTSTSKDTSVEVPVPNIMGGGVSVGGRNILNSSIDSSNFFTGSGDAAQSNSLSGRITVTVSEVLPNGYLIVQGEKRLTLNQGSEHVRFSGIVRPADIRSDNTVLSTSVANAQIIYGGSGTLAEANTKGWLARFLSSPLWPF